MIYSTFEGLKLISSVTLALHHPQLLLYDTYYLLMGDGRRRPWKNLYLLIWTRISSFAAMLAHGLNNLQNFRNVRSYLVRTQNVPYMRQILELLSTSAGAAPRKRNEKLKHQSIPWRHWQVNHFINLLLTVYHLLALFERV